MACRQELEMVNRQIVIGGMSGTGKSTLARALAHRWSLPLHLAGQFFASEAANRGVEPEILEQLAVNIPAIDRSVDQRIAYFCHRHKRYVIEGRLVHFNVPSSAIKILLCGHWQRRVDLICQRESQRRHALGDQRPVRWLAEAWRAWRLESRMRRRFQRHLGQTDYADPRHFNIVIDIEEKDFDTVFFEAVERITREEELRQEEEWAKQLVSSGSGNHTAKT